MPVKPHDDAVDNQASKQNTTKTTCATYIVYTWYLVPGIIYQAGTIYQVPGFRVGETTPIYVKEYVRLSSTSEVSTATQIIKKKHRSSQLFSPPPGGGGVRCMILQSACALEPGKT